MSLIILDARMAFSDHLVLEAVRTLTDENPGEFLSYEQIALRAAGCSTKTVERSMKRLEKCGKIKRVGGRRIGYRYQFPELLASA